MRYCFYMMAIAAFISCSQPKTKPAVVFQTDFGLKDGAVSAMKGVARGVAPDIALFDLTHEIPAYNIWEAAYRLNQSAVYWPAGTVFVSVVDPGVGTERLPVVLKTKSGHYIVSPDNGTLTLVAQDLGIEGVRQIDTLKNRREGSASSHTFHGRDIFAFTAARLASGAISFDEVGPPLKNEVVRINYQPAVSDGQMLKGNIPVLDIQYGNVWTNIPDSLLTRAGVKYGDSLSIMITHGAEVVFNGRMPLVRTFGDVPERQSLGYFNSLGNFSVALNMGSFADSFKVASGADWGVLLSKDDK